MPRKRYIPEEVIQHLRTVELDTTVNRDPECAGHETTASALKTTIYFGHPYPSWERGLNENNNGLLWS